MTSGKARFAFLLITLASVSVGASAKDIYVSPTGNDQNTGNSSSTPLATIAAASKRVAPGDTVYLMPGQYQEAIVAVTSGTVGQPITYKSSGPTPAILSHVRVGILVVSQAYLVFDGINVNGGAQAPNASVNSFVQISNSNHITVKNGSFQYANGWSGFEIAGKYSPTGGYDETASGITSYITIQNNKIDNVGDPTKLPGGNSINIMTGTVQHVLIQGNTLTHGAHDLLELFTDYGVVQDNVFNNDYRDLLGGNRGYRSMEVQGTFNVVQRNVMEHALIGSEAHAGPLASIRGNQNIVRQNALYDGIKEGIQTWCGAGVGAMANGRIYNNTMYQLGGSAWSMWSYSGDGCSPAGHFAFVNNLVVDSNQMVGSVAGDSHGGNNPAAVLNFNVSGPAPGLVDLGLGPTAQSTVKGNLFLPSGGGAVYVIFANAGGQTTMDGATNSLPQLFAANFEATPSLVNSTPSVLADFQLQPASKGQSAGVFLTNVVGSGSSNQMKVQDSLYFSDGNGVTTGDSIQLQGSTQKVSIVSIDRASNTLTLSSSVSFKDGQGVALPYNGGAPDVGIGATVLPTVVPLPPSSLAIKPAH